METIILVAREEFVDQRLDIYIASQLNISRSRIQRSIENSEVLVNNKPARSSYRIQALDKLEIDLPEFTPTEIIPQDLPLSILYEDEAILVISKPAGQVVHPGAGISRGTTANALAFYISQGLPGKNTQRPGIIHRLDKDTSGLMVVAKTEPALDSLGTLFHNRLVEKHYTALVYGKVEKQSEIINIPIMRDKKNRLRMATCKDGEGRTAISIYKVKKYYKDFTLLDVEIQTGRTHQIRVHCSYIKHPIVADELYGKGRSLNIQNPAYRHAISCLGRQFLHASHLNFTHPITHQRLQFTSSLPEDLQIFLSKIEY